MRASNGSSSSAAAAAAAAAILFLLQLRLCLALVHSSSSYVSRYLISAAAAAAPPAAYIVCARVPAGVVRFLFLSPFLPPFLLLPRAFPNSALLRTTLANSWLPFLKLLHLSFHHFQATTTFPNFAATLVFCVRVESSSRRHGHHHHLFRFLFFSLLPSSFLLFCHNLPEFLTRPIYSLLTYFSLLLAHHLLSLLFFRSTLSPPFHRPWLASSITDFWASRWNLNAHSLLRHAIYHPLLRLLWRSSAATPQKPPLRARIPAVIATFLASGLLHEISYYGIMQTAGLSWEATLFFLIHGFAASLEIYLRRTRPRHVFFRLPRPFRIILTLSFVVSTALALLYRALDRSTPIHIECAAELRYLLAALARRFWRREPRFAAVDAHIDIGLAHHTMPSIALN